jgi:hypothetical protein
MHYVFLIHVRHIYITLLHCLIHVTSSLNQIKPYQCHVFINTVPDPEKGVCTDPVGRDATLGVGGPGPPVRVSERQLSLDREVRRHDKVGRSKKDDPITASGNDYAQSKC